MNAGRIAEELFNDGIHVLTTGNHVWDKKEFVPQIAKMDRVLRPLNYPPGVPGFGSLLYNLSSEMKVAVINLSGRVFMSNYDCPYRVGKEEVRKLSRETKVIIIDFHGEATSEKIAFGYFMDGKVSAVIGTHTHVQTADEKILPEGTAYITDVGMTGPAHSVIGIEVEQIIERFLGMTPEILYGSAVKKGVIDFFTIYSRNPRVNINAAPKEVLLAVPGISSAVADAIIGRRQDKRITNPGEIDLPPESRPYLNTADSNAFTIDATGHREWTRKVFRSGQQSCSRGTINSDMHTISVR